MCLCKKMITVNVKAVFIWKDRRWQVSTQTVTKSTPGGCKNNITRNRPGLKPPKHGPTQARPGPGFSNRLV